MLKRLDEKLEDLMKLGDDQIDGPAIYYSKIVESSSDTLKDLIENVARLEEYQRSLDFKPILGRSADPD